MAERKSRYDDAGIGRTLIQEGVKNEGSRVVPAPMYDGGDI